MNVLRFTAGQLPLTAQARVFVHAAFTTLVYNNNQPLVAPLIIARPAKNPKI